MAVVAEWQVVFHLLDHARYAKVQCVLLPGVPILLSLDAVAYSFPPH